MTDNERMDRAKRIKRMREGRRGGDEPSPDEEESTDADQPESPATEAGSAESSTEETAATQEDHAMQETAQQTSDQAAESDATTTSPTETDAGDADEAVDPVESTAGSRAEIPDPETMEAALEEAAEDGEDEQGADTEEAAPAAGIAGEAVETTQEADTRVLEFTLANEQYGLDIRYIEEIVKHDNITRVPNTPDFVEGVVDLRGQITTILNPKVTLDKDDTTRGDLIVVFDSDAFDDQNIGWVVDDVRQVSPVHDREVNDPPMEEEYINGVIDRDEDDQFVIWTTPDLAMEEAG